MIKTILIFVIVAFVSYSIGRISHILGGHLNTPHHWIYGVIALIVGLIFREKSWAVYVIAFGVAFIISDFQDMIDLKFFGPDEPGPKRFWGID